MSTFIKFNHYDLNTKLLEKINKQNVVFAYPGETGYSLSCAVNDIKALERIRAMKKLSVNHNFTICCDSLKTAAQYAHIDNTIFKLMKQHTPCNVTFILPAMSTTPKKLSNKKRRNIGIRIPASPVDQIILKIFSGAMITTSAITKDNINNNLISAQDIKKLYHNYIDYIIEIEPIITNLSTIIDCTTEELNYLREGRYKIN